MSCSIAMPGQVATTPDTGTESLVHSAAVHPTAVHPTAVQRASIHPTAVQQAVAHPTAVTLTAVPQSDVHRAVASVDDPEYPGVSIVDLGLLETLDSDGDGSVRIGLIPTFSGCPALAMIAAEVQSAVAAVPGVCSVTVEWLRSPAWSTSRVSEAARGSLAQDFGVAVQVGRATPSCPRCASATFQQSLFGPSRCRSLHRCKSCGETVEVLRA